MLKENHIIIQKTARYYTLGEMNAQTESVWIVLHGFMQNGKSFIKQFEPLLNAKTLIIAPEGLNRFYVDDKGAKVGVTWMTREDRLNEIKDYINYLDEVYKAFNLNEFRGKITALGYSQGASTVTRWVNASPYRFDQCIVFAGEVAPELLPLQANSGLRRSKNFLIYGARDEFITPEALSKAKSVYNELHFTEIEFDGVHQLRLDTLKGVL
jgi:predicted esterase